MQKNQDKNSHKVALVTGSARRVGADIARLLHANNMNIVVHYNTSEREAKEICAEFNKIRPESAVVLQAELNEIGGLKQLIEDAQQAFGRLDVLVNNASRFYKTPMGEVTEQQWDDLFASNVKAPFFMAQAAAPYLAQHQGSIINIADIHGDRPMGDYSAYCISKAGIIMMTKALAKELGPAVRVNAVAPGPILWPEGENELSDDMKKILINRTALRTTGGPGEIAKAVLFFATAADFITGQILTVDGGRSLYI